MYEKRLNYRNTKCKEEKKSENDCPCSLKEELRYHGSFSISWPNQHTST